MHTAPSRDVSLTASLVTRPVKAGLSGSVGTQGGGRQPLRAPACGADGGPAVFWGGYVQGKKAYH